MMRRPRWYTVMIGVGLLLFLAGRLLYSSAPHWAVQSAGTGIIIALGGIGGGAGEAFRRLRARAGRKE